jgi:hypothetical protein
MWHRHCYPIADQGNVKRTMKIKSFDAILALALLLIVTTGFAHTWHQATTLTSAGATAMSADGKVICVVNSGSRPYISIDSGKTWVLATNSPPGGTYYSIGAIAINADGSKIFANLSSGETTFTYLSTNKGMSWTKTSFLDTTPGTAFPLACSADGSRVFALLEDAAGGSRPTWFYFSTNAGVNCNTSSIPVKAYTVACSADATRLIAGTTEGVYYSSDFGANWAPGNSPSPGMGAVCISSDGKSIGGLGTKTYISSDSGLTWRTNDLLGSFIACSANGTNWIIAGAYICTSVDAGVTWTTNLTSAQWLGGVVSADGCEMAADGSGQGTWIGLVTPSPQLNIQSQAPNAEISWLLPSTNFVLQQTTDLTTSTWTAVTNLPTLNFSNLNQEVTVPVINSSGFFRLIAQ